MRFCVSVRIYAYVPNQFFLITAFISFTRCASHFVLVFVMIFDASIGFSEIFVGFVVEIRHNHSIGFVTQIERKTTAVRVKKPHLVNHFH